MVVNSRLHPHQAAQWRTTCHSSAPSPFPFSAFCILPSALRLLCFQQLPTIKFCNPFIFITIRIAGGGYTPGTLHWSPPPEKDEKP